MWRWWLVACGAIYFFHMVLLIHLHVLLFPSSESKNGRPLNRAGGRVVYRTYVTLKVSNSLHSPGRYAYYNYKERLYEPAKCQGGGDGSAGVAAFQHLTGIKEEIEPVLNDHPWVR